MMTSPTELQCLIFFFFIIAFFSLSVRVVSPQPNPAGFRVQFIGHTRYITPEEEAKRDFCTNFWCTNDAHYLFTKSSQYIGVDPCVDFRNFSVNRADIIDVPDDRHFYRGFTGIAEGKFNERLRKLAASEFTPAEDNRVIRVVKNAFAHCVKSAHVLRHEEAHKDLVERLWSVNGSPYLGKHRAFNTDKFDEASDFGVWRLFSNNVPNDFTNESIFWNGENFSLARYFELEPAFALDLFFNLKVERCGESVCLKQSKVWELIEDEKFEFETFLEMFRTLDDAIFTRPQLRMILIDEVYRPALKNRRAFFKSSGERQKSLGNLQMRKVTLKELQERLSRRPLSVDWLRVINSDLFESSWLNANDEILVHGGIEYIDAMLENLLETNKSFIADAFDVSFFYFYRQHVITRFHNAQTVQLFGTTHGWQRWQTCLIQNTLKYNMYPALLVMYERERPLWDRVRGDFDRDLRDERTNIVGSAEKFVAEAVEAFKSRFRAEGEAYLPTNVAVDVLSQLKRMKIVISLRPSVFPVHLLETFYAELELNGDETYMYSMWEMRKFHRRLRNEPPASWRRNIDETVDTPGAFIEYDIERGNILYLSPANLVYPYYHPLRPRFFNMVTLFTNVLNILKQAVRIYVRKHHGLWVWPTTTSNIQIAFEHYQSWLRTNKELQIGANYLTNEQLYWVAVAINLFRKYHKTTPPLFHALDRLRVEYLHAYVKHFAGFQDAFRCNMTQRDINELTEFGEKYSLLQALGSSVG